MALHKLKAGLRLNTFRCTARCPSDLIELVPEYLLSLYSRPPKALSKTEEAMFTKMVARDVRALRSVKIPAFLIPKSRDIPVPHIGVPGRPEDYEKLPENFTVFLSEFDKNAMAAAASELIRWRIDRNLENRGFRQVRGRLVRDVGEYASIRIGGERFRVRLCEQVERSVRVLSCTLKPTYAECLVKIDVRRAPILSITDVFTALRRRGYTDERIARWICDNIEVVSVEPRGRAGKLLEINLNKLASEVWVPVTNETLDRYWARLYGIIIPRNDFVVMVQLDEDLILPYPASTCYVILTSEYFRRPLWLHPEDRYRRILEIAQMALQPYDYKGLVEIRGLSKPLSAEELCNIIGYPGEFGRVFMRKRRISKPKLLFGGGGVSARILEGLRKYGPYSGPAHIENLVIMVKADSKLKDKKIRDEFVRKLRSMYEELKLGHIKNCLFRLYERADKASSRVSELLSSLSGDLMIIFVTPGRGRPKRDFLMSIRDLIRAEEKDANRIKIQVLQEEKALTIAERRGGYRSILEALALSLYVKTSSHRSRRGTVLTRVPFILRQPADGEGVTCYGFIDISRRRKVEELIESTVSLSVIDPHGNKPVLKTVKIPKQPGEKLRLFTLADTLRELFMEAGRHERVVLFTDGPIVNDEAMKRFHKYFVEENIKRAVKELDISESYIEELRHELATHDVVIVNVVKRVIDRMFLMRADRIDNPRPWTYVRSSDNSVLLVASEFRGVRAIRNIPTVAPVELRIYGISHSQLVEKIEREMMERVLKEYCALSMLDWVSPYIEPKVPAYLKFVQKAGEIITAARLDAPPPWFTV